MKLRIVGGKLGGRQYAAPRNKRTHPMSERMKGGMFNALGDLSGLRVLDCFGGSGAITFEAISRGASHATIVEIDKSAHSTILDNREQLGITGQIDAIRANVSGWSDNNPDAQFDIVFCNPPFDNLKLSLIEKLTKHVKPDGLMVVSWPTQDYAPKLAGLSLETIKEKDYGDAMLVFYRKTG